MTSLEIKSFRKKYLLTQSNFADLFGMSFRSIQRYEKGESKQPKIISVMLNCFETSKDFRAEIINLNKDKHFVKKLFKQSKLININ